jgi:uncharacterized lipoprotein YajG
MFITMLLLVSVLFCACAGKPAGDSPETTEAIQQESNILETAYFNVVIPESWQDRYYAEVPAEASVNSVSGAFEYSVWFYEKTGYENNGPGKLVEILMTTDGDFEGFANGEKIGYMTGDQEYYFYAIYPSDVQFDENNQEIYQEMSADVQTVVRSIYSDTYTINFYE